MKKNRTNQLIKMLIMSAALTATVNLNAQYLLAEVFVDESASRIAAVTYEAIETDPLTLENWMTETNWVNDSTDLNASANQIVLEEWVEDSYDNAIEDALEVEEWMTVPFETETAVEEEIELEDWMLNSSAW